MSDTVIETDELVEEVCLGCECCDTTHVCCGYSDPSYCLQDACLLCCCDCCVDMCGCISRVLCCSCLRCTPIDWTYTCNGGLCGVDKEDRFCCQPCSRALSCVGRCFRSTRVCLYGRPDTPPKSKRNLNCCCRRIHNRWGEKGEFVIKLTFWILFSIYDTFTDVLLVYKWLTGVDVMKPVWNFVFPFGQDDEYDEVKHNAEAWMLVGFLGFAWGLSTIFSLYWSPVVHSGHRDPALYRPKCPVKSKYFLWPFHLVGLGPFVETVKAFFNSDWTLHNYRSNINPFRWIEFCFESGPSALLSLWVISKTNLKVHWAGPGYKEDIRFEQSTVILNIACLGWGLGNFLTTHLERDFGKTIYVDTMRPKNCNRMLAAVALLGLDIVFRCFIIILWLNFVPTTFLPAWNALIVLGALWLLEVFFVALNGQIASFWQYPLVAYSSIYQGGLYYFSRKWGDDDHHKVTVPLFWTRYLINWGLYLVCFFWLADTNISRVWNYGILGSGALIPLLFYLKPSTRTFRETYNKVGEWLGRHEERVNQMKQKTKDKMRNLKNTKWISRRRNNEEDVDAEAQAQNHSTVEMEDFNESSSESFESTKV